jgi:hypothetical protein
MAANTKDEETLLGRRGLPSNKVMMSTNGLGVAMHNLLELLRSSG